MRNRILKPVYTKLNRESTKQVSNPRRELAESIKSELNVTMRQAYAILDMRTAHRVSQYSF